MTEKEYVEKMMKLQKSDEEAAHAEADRLLLAALRDLGWNELANAYGQQRH